MIGCFAAERLEFFSQHVIHLFFLPRRISFRNQFRCETCDVFIRVRLQVFIQHQFLPDHFLRGIVQRRSSCQRRGWQQREDADHGDEAFHSTGGSAEMSRREVFASSARGMQDAASAARATRFRISKDESCKHSKLASTGRKRSMPPRSASVRSSARRAKINSLRIKSVRSADVFKNLKILKMPAPSSVSFATRVAPKYSCSFRAHS